MPRPLRVYGSAHRRRRSARRRAGPSPRAGRGWPRRCRGPPATDRGRRCRRERWRPRPGCGWWLRGPPSSRPVPPARRGGARAGRWCARSRRRRRRSCVSRARAACGRRRSRRDRRTARVRHPGERRRPDRGGRTDPGCRPPRAAPACGPRRRAGARRTGRRRRGGRPFRAGRRSCRRPLSEAAPAYGPRPCRSRTGTRRAAPSARPGSRNRNRRGNSPRRLSHRVRRVSPPGGAPVSHGRPRPLPRTSGSRRPTAAAPVGRLLATSPRARTSPQRNLRRAYDPSTRRRTGPPPAPSAPFITPCSGIECSARGGCVFAGRPFVSAARHWVRSHHIGVGCGDPGVRGTPQPAPSGGDFGRRPAQFGQSGVDHPLPPHKRHG
ncbi:hypothetical protein SUDANB23_03732 [Streptomyces sp. enrichment culture]